MLQRKRARKTFSTICVGLTMAWSLLIANTASAALVDFATVSSILSCGSAAGCTPGAGNVINFSLSTGGPATLQITYSANIEDDLNVDPTASANFGQLFLLCISCAGQTGNFDLAGATLDLNLNQGSDPFTDSGTFGTGLLSGALTVTAGNFGGVGLVSWANPASFALDNGGLSIAYILAQSTPPQPPGYLLSINSATTLQGLVTTAAVPLPAAVWSFGWALAALVAPFARKRHQR